MKADLKTTLTAADLCKEFGVGRSTLLRWRKDPRFPKPLPVKGLRWSRESIIAFMNSGNDPPPTPKLPKSESSASRAKRYSDALARLEKRGVRVKRDDK